MDIFSLLRLTSYSLYAAVSVGLQVSYYFNLLLLLLLLLLDGEYYSLFISSQ